MPLTRRLILQKARCHPDESRLQRLVGIRFQVLFHSPPGVLFTFPSRYCSAIGHQGVFRLRGWSPQIRTGFLGPRTTWDPHRECASFRLRGWHPLCRAFQDPSTMTRIFDSPPERQFGLIGPTTPRTQRLPAITRTRFGLFRFRSPLLTESRLLSLPVGTEMFHFPTFPPHALCVQAWVTGDESSRVSPFGNPRITVWLPTPRGLSQAPTSFIGSWCQGIHRMPLKTWLQITRCSRPLCSSQATGDPDPAADAYRSASDGSFGVGWFVPR